MSTSKLSICNLALTHLGVENIESLTEACEAARKLALVFDVDLEEVLRAHGWNFATKVEALAQFANISSPGFSYVYAYPATCLFVRRLLDSSGNDRPGPALFPYPFKEILVSDNLKGIAANLADAYGEYTFKVTDTSFYDPIFVKALSRKLAASLAIPLTGKPEAEQAQTKLYLAALEEAKRVNRSEVNPQTDQVSSFVSGR